MKILITGAAGFIGFHLSKKLLSEKYTVFGIDNLNNYYDVNLKKDRVKILNKEKSFFFNKINLSNKNSIDKIIIKNNIKYVVHLAAQAGVRHSIDNPETYFKSNLEGFFNILEVSKKNKIKHLIFASTSSVYGNNKNFPLTESANTDKPLSFYAATKKSNEVMAYSYSNIYKLPATALRFFTAYGPFGRPDMSLFKFTKSILENKKVDFFNSGNHIRDFTYIDDIVQGISNIIKKPSSELIPYNCFNIGSGKPNKLKLFLSLIESNLGKKAKIRNLPLQLGDVQKTHASVKLLKKYSFYKPKTNIKKGVKEFINWYKKNKI
ncbi:NAD-dependent epimerase/dehydratase family protein [Alphaproteobacteria bacterium]|nr:NAD-dependent epimerase/dehydratase family protein [Alphaproteobacteria bacterium]